MPNISEVFIMDLKNILPERDTKYCICISTGDNKYFLINTNQREMYDDFKIEKSIYDFLTTNSYVACSKSFILGNERIIKRLGNLNYEDMKKILDKIKNSVRLPKAEQKALTAELEEWIGNYQENQLRAKFGKR